MALAVALLTATMVLVGLPKEVLAAPCSGANNQHARVKRDNGTDTWWTGVKARIEFRLPASTCTGGVGAAAESSSVWVMLADWGPAGNLAYAQIGVIRDYDNCNCSQFFWEYDSNGTQSGGRVTDTFNGTPQVGETYGFRVLVDGANNQMKLEADLEDDGSYFTWKTTPNDPTGWGWDWVIPEYSAEIGQEPTDFMGTSSNKVSLRDSEIRNDDGAGFVDPNFFNVVWRDDEESSHGQIECFASDHLKTWEGGSAADGCDP
jgi:hypothetical protein